MSETGYLEDWCFLSGSQPEMISLLQRELRTYQTTAAEEMRNEWLPPNHGRCRSWCENVGQAMPLARCMRSKRRDGDSRRKPALELCLRISQKDNDQEGETEVCQRRAGKEEAEMGGGSCSE